MRIKKHLHYANFWYLLGLAYLVVLTYCSLSPDAAIKDSQIPYLDKYFHFTAYFLLSFPLIQLGAHFLSGFLMASLYGVLIEFLQLMGGVREFQYSDMLANALGALVGVALNYFVLVKLIDSIDNKIYEKLKK